MTCLTNPRHERYAQLRAKGVAASKAAPAAGYSPNSAIYTQLDRDPTVTSRIEELSRSTTQIREERAETLRSMDATEISEAWVMQELVRMVADAREDRDYRNANVALKLIGEQLGMWTSPTPSKCRAAIKGGGDSIELTLRRLDAISDSLASLDAPPPESPILDAKCDTKAPTPH